MQTFLLRGYRYDTPKHLVFLMVSVVSVIARFSGYSNVMNKNNSISPRCKVSRLKKVLPQFDLPLIWTALYMCAIPIQGAEAFIYSDAIGEILKVLPMRWSWMRIAWIVPRSIRDAVYRAFAARRIQWFGKVDACRFT